MNLVLLKMLQLWLILTTLIFPKSTSTVAFLLQSPHTQYKETLRKNLFNIMDQKQKNKVSFSMTMRNDISLQKNIAPLCSRTEDHYDLVVIGAGASGMFAAGTAASLGRRTLILETTSDADFSTDFPNIEKSSLPTIGGDCTNAACVPSKAMRAAASVALQSGTESSIHGSYATQIRNNNKDFNNFSELQMALDHVETTVEKVRRRDAPSRLATSSPNLKLLFSSNITFQNSHELQIQQPREWNSSLTSLSPQTTMNTTNEEQFPTMLMVHSKQFIICTGASPYIPPSIHTSAQRAKIPVLTYRTLFQPRVKQHQEKFSSSSTDTSTSNNDSSTHILMDLLQTLQSPILSKKEEPEDREAADLYKERNKDKNSNIVIVGGGPTGCEMAQILSRLTVTDPSIIITLVSPEILPMEDVATRAFARKLLQNDGIQLCRHRRVKEICLSSQNDKKDQQKHELPRAFACLDDESRIPVDILICATGRRPGPNLKDMKLDEAGIQWTETEGILVNSRLQSISAKHVFAAGDCASAVRPCDRRAAHAGWTGYHAVQSAILPRLLRPSSGIHPAVPRMPGMDPEIASIGLTRVECIAKYGENGFQHLLVPEEGSDRFDMDSIRRTIKRRESFDSVQSLDISSVQCGGFVELRVLQPSGRILGATICMPGASDLINEIGLAMTNRLSVRDIAKSMHYYPSHGYLMHRTALALALSNIWGILSVCGPIGKSASWVGRNVQSVFKKVVSFQRRPSSSIRQWQAEGANNEFEYSFATSRDQISTNDETGKKDNNNTIIDSISFLEASFDPQLCQLAVDNKHLDDTMDRFVMWQNSKPT